MSISNRFSGVFLTALLAAAIGLAGCSSGGSEDDDEICNNGTDDDGDGDSDCSDSDCTADPTCTGGAEDCDNGTDDDGDTDVDCDDSDCAADPACTSPAEDCDNGTDDDGDTDIDCADSDCAADPACTGACTADVDYGDGTLTNQEIAAAGLPDALVVIGDLNADPDGIVIEMYSGFGAMADGIVPGTYILAGDDLNYATCGLCVRLFTETADDGYFATGGSVLITSVEPTVVIDLSAVTFEHVTIDGTTFESTPHADGCTSELNSAGFDVAPPPVEICDNEIDDDGDTDVDCDDADCAADVACTGPVEICDNTIDDDGDTDIDCDDADCAADPFCTGTVCTADADYGTIALTDQVVFGASLPDALGVRGALNADIDGIQLEMYDGFGALAAGIVPGTYTLAGDDLNYSTCGLCVRMYTETADSGYFATAGTVDITSVDPFIATLSGLAFEHVDIDGTTFVSTPHADGCVSAVASTGFDLTPTGPICTADADYGAATLTNQLAEDGLPDFIGAVGDLNADIDKVQVELYDTFGVFTTGGITTGTFAITGDELNYSTCGACVRLLTETTPDSGYMATGGTITVTALSPNLVVDLSDVTFEHVTIDGTTFVSTPHADMCTTAVTSASFDVLPTL